MVENIKMITIKDLTYQALNAVTFGKGVKRTIGGETFRFPARFSRYYESNYEPETFNFLRQNAKKGATVLDIGAHIGLFSVLIARLVGEDGQVFSFEPTPYTRQILQKVVELNKVSNNVVIRGEAVSDKSGKTSFYDTGTEVSNANSLVKTERSKEKIEIQMVSVDDFVERNHLTISCLKIDVEGAELNLLRGAIKTFTKQRPIARLGLHPPFIEENGQTLSEIWDVLKDYQMQILFDGKEIDKEWFIRQTDVFDVSLFPIMITK